MTVAGAPAGRDEIVDAYGCAAAAFTAALVDASRRRGRGRAAEEAVERISERLRGLGASYLALVTPRPVSRCPHTGRALELAIDDGGLDGMWWNHDQPLRPDQPWLDSCVAVTGAVARRGPVPDVAWPVWPGPEVPYVVPDLLARGDVLAVISSLPISDDTGFLIDYFAPPAAAIDPGVNTWGANAYGFIDAGGERRWGTVAEPAVERDFELAPWIERGKLAWIFPGDATLTLQRAVDGCPFLDLPGDRSLVSIRGGRVTRVPDLTRSRPAMPRPQGATIMSSPAAIPSPQPAPATDRRRRWRFGWLGTVAGVLALAATLGGLALTLLNSPSADGFGTVSVEDGAAQVRTDAGAPFRDVQPGEEIALGAALRTDDAGFATLTLNDGSILRLGPGTAVAFEQTDNQRVIRIADGSAWYRATPNEGADPIAVATDGAFLEGDRVAVAVECAQEATCAIQPLEGALTVATTSGDRVPLAPGEELTVDDAGGVAGVTLVEDPEADAWVARNRETDRVAGLGPVGASAVAPGAGSLAAAEMNGTWHFTTRVTESTSKTFDPGAEPAFDIELSRPCPQEGCDFGATMGRYEGTGTDGAGAITFTVSGTLSCTEIGSDRVTVPDAGAERLAVELQPTAAMRKSGAWEATGVEGTAEYEQTVDIACNEADQLGTFHASFEVAAQPLEGGNDAGGSPTPESAAPEPSPAAASYEFLGWSIETTAIESQSDPSVRPPTDLVPSGGTISVCGGERLVYWVRYENAPTEQVVQGSFVGPNVEIQPSPERYPSGDGTMTFWWGYTDGPLDERDAGQYQSEVSVDGTDTVVATGEVTAIC